MYSRAPAAGASIEAKGKQVHFSNIFSAYYISFFLFFLFLFISYFFWLYFIILDGWPATCKSCRVEYSVGTPLLSSTLQLGPLTMNDGDDGHGYIASVAKLA